ncbi:hypothetical protein K493DRAFT_300642 [Basidiobolus meristosporus CBS 931.73]|uniref:Uncharacterized protein n=1 Tax=Basidiobolus meristosporus CBS 931.73 TaxID=1314790 RepID=A0A1Y1YG81_9FUNG|nr:hypothetical protein K493DRAFT_300642 [Basidiobolus meristosporus CBS 931.73]|eukprot:ORX96987.1 hypothetical protein K493DRAFT_300642 [Basidiobolus meristosporus CBS 931.73]
MSSNNPSDIQPLNIPGRRRALSVGSSLGRQSFSHITCNPNPNFMSGYGEKSAPFGASISPQNSPPTSGYFHLAHSSSFPKPNQFLDSTQFSKIGPDPTANQNQSQSQNPHSAPNSNLSVGMGENRTLLPNTRIQALKATKRAPDRPDTPMGISGLTRFNPIASRFDDWPRGCLNPSPIPSSPLCTDPAENGWLQLGIAPKCPQVVPSHLRMYRISSCRYSTPLYHEYQSTSNHTA